MNISKFTLGETLKFLPKAIWPKDKEYVKAVRAISKLTGATLINVGHIDIAKVDPTETLELTDANLPSNELMILAKCPLEADDVTGEPTSWGNALVRLTIGNDYLHAALAVQPKPNGVFIIARVMRMDKEGTYTSIFPEEGNGGRVDEIMSFEDMRRMVFGLASQVLKSKLVPTNPNIIYDKRLRNMSKKEKETYIEYHVDVSDKPKRIIGESETRSLGVDLQLDTASVTNRLSPGRAQEIMEPRFTSTKLQIMKSVRISDRLKLNPVLRNESLDLSESILFSEINIKHLDFDSSQKLNYERMPFRDFMFVADLESTDEATGESRLDVNGLLARMKKINDDTVRQYIFFKNSLICIHDVDIYTGLMKRVAPLNPDEISARTVNEFVTNVVPVIKHVLYTIINFEPIILVDPTNSYQIKKRVPLQHREKYLEYTLDLNKSRISYVNGGSKGGSHASPIEHRRMGHERKYKSGKTVWINDIIVNEGKGGRIEKDYKL